MGIKSAMAGQVMTARAMHGICASKQLFGGGFADHGRPLRSVGHQALNYVQAMCLGPPSPM